ncbi:hypothetical protein [Viridibacillus arvi]
MANSAERQSTKVAPSTFLVHRVLAEKTKILALFHKVNRMEKERNFNDKK